MILTLLLAAQAAPLPNCDQDAADKGIQSAMNICAYRDYLIADQKLNEQWKKTAARMKERDVDWRDYKPEWDDRPGYFASLLEAQRAWITYRDAHCRTDGYNARGGTLESLLVSMCKTALTQTRTQQLSDLIDYPD